MRTVGQVAELANLTVRALHHYDHIGLVEPSGRTDAGYRLYDDRALERLQQVLFYRELGFGLEDIRDLMADPDFDRLEALREQRELLVSETDRLRRMVAAVDAAIETHETGTTMSDEAMFEVFGDRQRELYGEAEETWGDTDAWAQSRRRTAGYSAEDWEEVKTEGEEIMRRIAAVYRSGAEPDSEAAMDAVEAHRRQIDERYYDCPPQMQVQLGEMYVQDPRFRATYEDVAEGLAEWVRDAIVANAARHRA